MRLVELRIGMVVIATITAILFLSLAYVFPDDSILILNIEVILLPSIYIVSNYYIENTMEARYNKLLDHLFEKSTELERKYYIERMRNNKRRLK